MSVPSEGRPLHRTPRSPIANVIDMERINNPCGIASPSSGTGAGVAAESGDSVKLDAQMAHGTLTTLQTNLGPSLCSGMTSDITKLPTFTAGMTRDEKMRLIYKALVHQAAHVQAIAKQKEGTNMSEDYNRCVGSLQNLQCSLSSAVGYSSAELSAIAGEVGTTNFTPGVHASEREVEHCVIIGSTVSLLDMLITLITPAQA